MAKKKRAGSIARVGRNVKNKVMNIVMPKPLKLKSIEFGLAGGLITAICILAITILVDLTGQGLAFYILIYSMYGSLGYNTSVLGIVLGAFYGFIDGFIITWLFAVIYNKLV